MTTRRPPSASDQVGDGQGLTELDTLDLPHLQTAISEAVAYAEMGFNGVIQAEGTAAKEAADLLTELHAAGGIP
jgi:hypothetical protein